MAEPHDGERATALFELLWTTLADVVGTAATAALLRRAAKRASTEHIELDGLIVAREGRDHTYWLPKEWSAGGGDPMGAMRALIRELGPLLVEMTGPVLLHRLERLTLMKGGSTVSGEEISKWLRNA